MATENEELLVSIKADVAALRAGMAQGEKAVKDFEKKADDLKKSVNGFRQSFNVGVNAVGGLDSALDLMSGKAKLSASSVTSLLQIVAAASTPAGAAAVGFGLIATGILRVVENERQMKQNRIDAYLKEVGKEAEAAAKGWDAYNKAIETGSRGDADRARALAQEGSEIDQRQKKFQDDIKALREQNRLKADSINLIDQEIKKRESGAKSTSKGIMTIFEPKETKGSTDDLKKKLDELKAQVEANDASIAGYEKGIEDLGKSKAKVTKDSDDLNKRLKEEAELFKKLNLMWAEQDEAARKRGESMNKSRAGRELTSTLAAPIETDNEMEKNLRESELALADFRAEMMLLHENDEVFPEDWLTNADALKAKIIENREALHQFNEEQKAQAKANREYEQSMEAMGTAAGDMFVSMADGSADANEAMKDFMRAMMQEIMKMLIARVMGNAAVYGSEVAVQNAWSGPAAIGIGVAAAAAMSAAMMGMIPGFDDGGIVGGTTKTGDKQLIRANSGEEVLREDDPRHRKNFRDWWLTRNIPGFAEGGIVGSDVRATPIPTFAEGGIVGNVTRKTVRPDSSEVSGVEPRRSSGAKRERATTVNNFNSLVPYNTHDVGKMIRKARFDEALEEMVLTHDLELEG